MLTQDLLNSFDFFVEQELPRLLAGVRICASTYEVGGERSLELKFGASKVRPMMMLEKDGDVHTIMPSACRARRLTYSLSWYTDISIRRSHGRFSTLRDCYLGRIPCMLGSAKCHLRGKDPGELCAAGECPLDPKGYFIVSGCERSLIMQRSHVHNEFILYRRKDDWTIAVKCETQCVRVTQMKFRERARVVFPKLAQPVPLCSLLEHLGVSRLDFERHLTQAERAFFRLTLEEDGDLVPAPTFMVGHPEEVRREELLRTYLLPIQESGKGAYLILMAKRLFKAIQEEDVSDRDSLEFTKVENVSDLLSSLLYHLLRRTSSSIKMYLQKYLGEDESDGMVLKAFERSTVVTDGLAYAFSTGIWDSTLANSRRRVGIAQLLQRANQRTLISQLKRLSSAVPSSQKIAKPRYLHPSTWGRVCIFETPEGAACGLETQICLNAKVSLRRDSRKALEALRPFVDPLLGVSEGNPVFLDGVYLGNTSSRPGMIAHFRGERRGGRIHEEISIAENARNIHVRTCSGRILRRLQYDGGEEYLDFHEEKNMLLGETHREIDNALFGYGASLIPFADRMPTPRSTYQCAMQKQAVSVPNLIFDHPLNMQTTTNVLLTGQRPLVGTRVGEKMAYALPAGFNAVVAVVVSEGYNQEDALVVSRGAVERGLGLCIQLRTQSVSMSCGAGETFELRRPEGRPEVVCSVEENGLPLLNTEVKKGDLILGRVKVSRGGEQDASLYAGGPGRIHRVLFTHGRGGGLQISVQIREMKPIQQGDKLASRSAQKGVVSLLVPGEDLPFNAEGIVPDIIISPNAFPSRMTVSQLLEAGMGKLATRRGRMDGSSFQKVTPESLEQELRKAGFGGGGKEVLFDGKTGRKIQAAIFMAPTLYQRLKHFASSKIHARSWGRRNMVTRQPSEGRSHAGGLRFGEMEKDTLVAHGAPHLLLDTMMTRSDAHEMRICATCGDGAGLRGIKDPCARCGKFDIKNVRTPYCFKLLTQELMAQGVHLKMHLT